jgi:aminopeptidase N
LGFLCSNEKLIIQLPKDLSEGTKFLLNINYFAFPKRGFHFINSNDNDHISDQAWTQGQMIESKYWFPCIDEPQIKFRWEISVCVPNDFVVISNGKDMDIKDNNKNNTKKIFRWVEDNPNTTYLASIVIGKFFVNKQTYDKNENESRDNEKIKLLYCVPADKKDRIQRTFGETPQMMMFFESFFGVSYPYSKYAQTTVKDFEYGGMENTSCTTLQEEILLDERVGKDDDNYYFSSLFSNRSIIAHELVHQWFGDLVTCLDWEDIWLNEGFATYGEALYIENINKNNKNEFLRYMALLQGVYIDEACNDYERSLVTSRYKYPDELFDGHSYKKGAWILHMLRYQIGETNFKMSLKKYLEKYQYKNAKTSDFMKVVEEVSGEDLESFFRQWVNSPGHPELGITFDDKTNSIKIIQTQDKLFNFKLEIGISSSNVSAPKIYSFNIKERENTIHISKFEENKNEEKKPWFSIDPELKILKEIKSYEVPISMIINQIENKATIIGRRQGITAINEKSITKENCNRIIEILKNTILNDEFYWVSTLAASKLGEFVSYKKIDQEIKNKAFDTIRECLNEIRNKSKIGKNVVISNLISALGNYISNISDYDSTNSLFNELKDIAENDNESYYIQGAALSTIGDYKNGPALDILNDAMDKENTFNDYIPRQAIGGLAKFSKVKETKTRKYIIESLIRKTNSKNSNSIRNRATVGLTEFLIEPETEPDKKTVNYDVFTTLMRCLGDPWLHIRKAACGIFETKFNQDDMEIKDKDQLLNKLEHMTNTDLSYDVRRNAQLCLFAIRDRTYSKKRKAMNEKEFNEYVSTKLKMRTKHVFGPKMV